MAAVINSATGEQPGEDDADDLFIDADEFALLVDTLKRRKNLILQGPPGVGKTFIAQRLARAIASTADRVKWVQ